MYTIDELALMSGFTTRTLRNYIKADILHGNKEDGIWRFSEENVNDFLNHPSVRPGIESKQNSIAYDFLAGRDNAKSEMCILLDREADADEAKKTADFFCAAANRSEHIRFSFSFRSGKLHIILKGGEKELREIMRSFYMS